MIREYRFLNPSKTIIVGENLKNEQLFKVFKKDNYSDNYIVLDISKYEIANEIIILDKSYDEILVKVADTGAELGLVSIPYTTEITENNTNAGDDKDMIDTSIIVNETNKAEILVKATEILDKSVLINNGRIVIGGNYNDINSNTLDIIDEMNDLNQSKIKYKKIKDVNTSFPTYNDDGFTINLGTYQTLSDNADVYEGEALIYSEEANVANNLDLSQVNSAISSLNSNLESIKGDVVNLRNVYSQVSINESYSKNAINKSIKYNQLASKYKLEAESARDSANSDKIEALLILENVNTINNLIDDGSKKSDKTYSSEKSETVFTVNLPTNVMNSQLIETKFSELGFINLGDKSECLDGDEFKVYSVIDGRKKRTKAINLKTKIKDKDFGSMNTTSYKSGGYLIGYNQQYDFYFKSNVIKSQNFGKGMELGNGFGDNPIVRFTFNTSNTFDGNFEVPLSEMNVGDIYNLKGIKNDGFFYKCADLNVGIDNILRCPISGCTNLSGYIDGTEITIVNDDPYYISYFDENNSFIQNATYSGGSVLNTEGLESSINIAAYEQEAGQGGFKSYYTNFGIILNNYDIYEATNTTFKTKKEITINDDLYVDNVVDIVNADSVTETTSSGDLTLTSVAIGIGSIQISNNSQGIGYNLYNVKQNGTGTGFYLRFSKYNNVPPLTLLNYSDVTYNYISSLFYSVTSVTSIYMNSCFDLCYDGNYIYAMVYFKFNGKAISTSPESTYEYNILLKLNLNFSVISYFLTDQYINQSFYVVGDYLYGIRYTSALNRSDLIQINTLNGNNKSFNSFTSKYDNYLYVKKNIEGYLIITQKGAFPSLFNESTFTRLKVSTSFSCDTFVFSNDGTKIITHYFTSLSSSNYFKVRVASCLYSDFGTLYYTGDFYIGSYNINYLDCKCFNIGRFNNSDYYYAGNYLIKIEDNLTITGTASLGSSPQAFIKKDDNKTMIFFNNNINYHRILDNRPTETYYTVDITSLGLTTPPTNVLQVPILTFKEGLTDTSDITPADLTLKNIESQNSYIDTGDVLRIETVISNEQTDTKRFYMWQLIGSKFKALLSSVTYFTRKGV